MRLSSLYKQGFGLIVVSLENYVFSVYVSIF